MQIGFYQISEQLNENKNVASNDEISGTFVANKSWNVLIRLICTTSLERLPRRQDCFWQIVVVISFIICI